VFFLHHISGRSFFPSSNTYMIVHSYIMSNTTVSFLRNIFPEFPDLKNNSFNG
jgi:hypothetical protein